MFIVASAQDNEWAVKLMPITPQNESITTGRRELDMANLA
jgi:hypothetical protein